MTLDWRQPTGFDRLLEMTYTVSRPVGPEFEHWEPSAVLTIRPAELSAPPSAANG